MLQRFSGEVLGDEGLCCKVLHLIISCLGDLHVHSCITTSTFINVVYILLPNHWFVRTDTMIQMKSQLISCLLNCIILFLNEGNDSCMANSLCKALEVVFLQLLCLTLIITIGF